MILQVFLSFLPRSNHSECSDVISDHGETDNQDEESAQRADKELFSLSEDLNNWPEPDEEPEITESKSSLLCSINRNVFNCQNIYLIHTFAIRAKQRIVLFVNKCVIDCTLTESPYLEPPDVQRQLNHYNLMAQADAPSQSNVQETKLPDSRLLRCELCNFSTGHLSSMRRHYLNRHGKKILRCKDCDFFTGLR